MTFSGIWRNSGPIKVLVGYLGIFTVEWDPFPTFSTGFREDDTPVNHQLTELLTDNFQRDFIC